MDFRGFAELQESNGIAGPKVGFEVVGCVYNASCFGFGARKGSCEPAVVVGMTGVGASSRHDC